ncbi:MAG: DNA-3-methyladenine glycosylase I [Desulfobacteraceae bacterium]
MRSDDKPRCAWMGDDLLMQQYHDQEWGVPLHDDGKWFEFIVLDSFQAGLSWRTVLHKRAAFRKVFYGFDPEKVARMTPAAMEKARQNKGIIRNRLKIKATVANARAFLNLKEREGTFDQYIWSFTNGRVVQNAWKTLDQIPAATPLSDRVSKALKSEGFSFVGTTICYALLQAAGVVNDHLVHCFRYQALAGS